MADDPDVYHSDILERNWTQAVFLQNGDSFTICSRSNDPRRSSRTSIILMIDR